MHVMIGCPSDRGLMHYHTLATVFNIQEMLADSGFTYEFFPTAFTEIVESRNTVGTAFFKSKADILVGIDDDVGVSNEAFHTMISANVPYIAACIPQRVMSLEKFAEGLRQGFSDQDAQRYAAPLVDGPGTAFGISQVEMVGTGFFVLRRQPLDALVDAGVIQKRVKTTVEGDKELYGFYDYFHDANGNRLLEDYSFCRRLRDAGFPVHAYKGPGINHSGEMTFHS